MTKPELKYVHLKSEDYPQHDVVSVGYRLVDVDLVSGKKGKIEVQIARCRWPDRWTKDIAHHICEGRMKKHGPMLVYEAEVLENFTIGELLASDFHPDYGSMLPHSESNLESAETSE